MCVCVHVWVYRSVRLRNMKEKMKNKLLKFTI